MRILVVAPMPASPTAHGAIPRVLHALLTGLGRRHEVTVAVVAGPEEAELAAVEELHASGVDVHAACRHEPRNRSERWERRQRLAGGWLRGRLPWRSVWYREPGMQPILDRLLVERRFDVIAVEDSAAAVYRFGHTVPTVFTEHEVRQPRRIRLPAGPPSRWPRGLLSELDWSRWPSFQRSTWARFDLVQTFTDRDAAAICTLAPEIAERVRVTPFGIELPDALPPSPPSSRELVFVGNFTHPPNVDGALWLGTEIMPGLRARGVPARLSLIGPAPPPAVEALAAEDIRVLGAVPDIRSFLGPAAVVLAPLRTGGGMRMKVLEALALGRAVVTTSRGADGLGGHGVPPLVVADTASEVVQATAELLADPASRERLGADARRFVADFYSPDPYARRLERVYEEARERRYSD